MTTFDAVYRSGALHPLTPIGFAEGTAVRVTVESTPAAPPDPFDPAEVLARILASAAKFNPATDKPNVTSDNVDAVLYGSPDGAR